MLSSLSLEVELLPHLLDAEHESKLRFWLETLEHDAFVTFIGRKVAPHLLDAGFDSKLRFWLETLGRDGFVTFIGGGVARHLLDAGLESNRLFLRLNTS